MWIWKFCCFAAIVALVYAEDEHKFKPGYCLINGVHVKEGEWVPAPIGQCHEINCDKAVSENEQLTSSKGCGTFSVQPPCTKIDYDYSLPFPHCCDKAHCPDDK